MNSIAERVLWERDLAEVNVLIVDVNVWMAQLVGAAVVTTGLLIGARYLYTRMPKAGSPLFKVG